MPSLSRHSKKHGTNEGSTPPQLHSCIFRCSMQSLGCHSKNSCERPRKYRLACSRAFARGCASAWCLHPRGGRRIQDERTKAPKQAFQQDLRTSGDEYGRQGLSGHSLPVPEHGSLCGARFLEVAGRTETKAAGKSPIPLGKDIVLKAFMFSREDARNWKAMVRA